MAELVDALDSKSSIGDNVGVRFPLPAPHYFYNLSCKKSSKSKNFFYCNFFTSYNSEVSQQVVTLADGHQRKVPKIAPIAIAFGNRS